MAGMGEGPASGVSQATGLLSSYALGAGNSFKMMINSIKLYVSIRL